MKGTTSTAPKPTIRFNAKAIESKTKSGLQTTVVFPMSVSAKLGAKGAVSVDGIFNALPFQTTLDISRGTHVLVLNKVMHDVAKITDGETVMIEIMRVADEVETRIPADLRKAIYEIPKAKSTWEMVTSLAKRDWVYWLCSTKNDETRIRRIEKACDMLSTGKKRVCCFGGVSWLMKTGGGKISTSIPHSGQNKNK